LQIKAKLDDLRTTIEASHGPLPEDLQDEGRAPSAPTTPAEQSGRLHGASDSAAAAKYVSDDEDGDVKDSARHPSLSGLRGLSDKGSPGSSGNNGAGGSGRAPYPSGDIAGSEPKGFLFAGNKSPIINVER